MAKYYFHLREGDDLIEDPDGFEVADLKAAKSEALEAFRENIAEYLTSGRELTLRSIEIEDELGRVLARITLFDALSGVIPSEILKDAQVAT